MIEALVIHIDMKPTLAVLEACCQRLAAASRDGTATQELIDEVSATAMAPVAQWTACLPAVFAS